MITWFYTFLVIFGLGLIFWLYMILFTEPKFGNNGRNRIEKNWNEGGGILLGYLVVVAFFISIAVAKAILWANFLEKGI